MMDDQMDGGLRFWLVLYLPAPIHLIIYHERSIPQQKNNFILNAAV